MPFIDGRFYANPAYGMALERSRRREAGQDGEPEEIDVRYASTGAQKPPAGTKTRDGSGAAPQYDSPQNEKEATLANVIYHETSGLRAKPGVKPGTAGSAEDLHNARVAIGEVARHDLDAGHPNYVAHTELKPDEEKTLAAGNRYAVQAHNDSLAAARQALSGSKMTGGATQYRLRPHPHTRISIRGKAITTHYGPFNDVQGGEKAVVVAP
jgi:hypothetical protein